MTAQRPFAEPRVRERKLVCLFVCVCLRLWINVKILTKLHPWSTKAGISAEDIDTICAEMVLFLARQLYTYTHRNAWRNASFQGAKRVVSRRKIYRNAMRNNTRSLANKNGTARWLLETRTHRFLIFEKHASHQPTPTNQQLFTHSLFKIRKLGAPTDLTDNHRWDFEAFLF